MLEFITKNAILLHCLATVVLLINNVSKDGTRLNREITVSWMHSFNFCGGFKGKPILC